MATILNLLQGKNRAEIANIKANEIALIASTPRDRVNFNKSIYDIEITSIEAFDGGVTVLARAWQNGKQIGFGDGTVDLEKFILFNPPILVPDGTTRTVMNPTLGEMVTINNHVENPRLALQQRLVAILDAKKQKFNDSRIVPDKVGNTTLNQVVTQDAYISVTNQTTWALAHDATSGTLSNDAFLALLARSQTASNHDIRRAGLTFDTSSIGADSISSATLSVYHTTAQAQISVDATTVDAVAFTPADATSLVGDDYDQFGTTVLDDVPVLSVTDDAYHNFTIPTGSINASGYTSLGLRLGEDTDNNTSTGTDNNMQFSSSDVAGSSEDPILTVEHTASATDNALAMCNF